MRPYVICHMMSSLDGKTDPTAIRQFSDVNLFEATHPKLGGDAWLCGRVTLQVDFGQYAEDQPFKNDNSDPVGQPVTHVARRHDSYAISADTRGQILWKDDMIDGDHVIALVSQRASKRYLETLKARGVSFIAIGEERIDFARAFAILASQFGIKRLLVEGGGTINGAVLAEGLIDELSLLLLPGVDGRDGPSASFDGRPASPIQTVPAKLNSIERLDNDVLWLRYRLSKPRADGEVS